MATQAAQAIYPKMAAILQDMDAIGKNTKNQAQGFNYRGIDDVYNAINPLLAKHKVFMTAAVIGKSREERTNQKGTVLTFTCLHMRYRFYAEDGSFVETEAEGEGMDSGDKSSNKAMAVAHKYALLQAFCVPTKDLDDPDAESHEVAGQPRAQAVKPADTDHRDNSGSDRAAKAKAWAQESTSFVLGIRDSQKLSDWHKKFADAIASLKDLDPQGHKRLLDAIEKRQGDLHPMAA